MRTSLPVGKPSSRTFLKLMCTLLFCAFVHGARAQFTYTFTAVPGTYSQVSASGSDLNSIESDNAHSSTIDLGFDFGYNGQVVSQVKVNSNGFLSMDLSDSPNSSQSSSNSMGSADSEVR